MTPTQYRKQWLKLHRSYEKRAFRIFRKGLRKAARKIPFQTLDEWNYKTTIAFNIAESDIFESYYTAYLSIGTLYGNRVVRSIKKDTKSVEIDTFQLAYKQQLQAWLFENAGLKITTVKQSLIDYLLKEISNGLDEGYDIREMSRRIQKLVNSRSFYRWQAMRIARTETTAAANYGASVATEKSIYVLEKIWISSNDARTRQIEKGDKHDHMDMHLVKVEEKGVFNVQGDFLRFPGDPKGRASNVINCRCTVALKAKRDADGRLIRKGDSVNRFNPLPKPKPTLRPKPIQAPQKFVPAKNIKEANEFAKKNLGMKFADYRGLDLKVANEVNELYVKTKGLMPDLRTFGVGSAQKANRAMKSDLIAFYKKSEHYQRWSNTYGASRADRFAKNYANKYVSNLGKNTLAWSTNNKGVYLNSVTGEKMHLDLTKYSGVYVNEKFGKSSTVINELVEVNEKAGWFYKGSKGIKSIIAHEIGHEIDKTIKFNGLQAFKDIYTREHAKGINHVINSLSKYGATAGGRASHKPLEMIAEAWAEYTTVKNPRRLSKEIGDLMLEEYYKLHIKGTVNTTYAQWRAQTLQILKQ